MIYGWGNFRTLCPTKHGFVMFQGASPRFRSSPSDRTASLSEDNFLDGYYEIHPIVARPLAHPEASRSFPDENMNH